MKNSTDNVGNKIAKKVARRIWWLQHRKTIIITIAMIVGAAIFAYNFTLLITL
jgi:hypothetical protein